MGDSGDYWREHREYSRKQRARRIGMEPHYYAEKPFMCGIDGCRKHFWKETDLAQHMHDKHKVKP